MALLKVTDPRILMCYNVVMEREYRVVKHQCMACDQEISDTGLCSYDCQWDTYFLSSRPKNSVRRLVYQMTLLSEENYDSH